MPQNVERYALEDGDYTFAQVQSDRRLGVLLPSLGPDDGWVVRVENGWAQPVRIALPSRGEPTPVASQPAGQPQLPAGWRDLSYAAVRKLAIEAGYTGVSRRKVDIVSYLEAQL